MDCPKCHKKMYIASRKLTRGGKYRKYHRCRHGCGTRISEYEDGRIVEAHVGHIITRDTEFNKGVEKFIAENQPVTITDIWRHFNVGYQKAFRAITSLTFLVPLWEDETANPIQYGIDYSLNNDTYGFTSTKRDRISRYYSPYHIVYKEDQYAG